MLFDPVTGELVTDNLDIGGTMWFQNEGLSVLATFLIVSPQWDIGKLRGTSVVTVGENSIIRGIRVNLKDLSYRIGVGGLLSGKYKKQRMFASRLRKLTDREVLALNPSSVFSFSQLTSAVPKWLRLIKRVYNRD